MNDATNDAANDTTNNEADDGAHDATLLDRLDHAFDELEPIPAHLSAAARAAFSWRRADAALAELLFDSAQDELVGIRGTSSDRRSFRFGADQTVIRVHLTAETLVVMVEPPVSVDCRIASDDEVTAHRTDEFGELVLPAPDVPFRIEVDLPSGTTHTPWIT